MKDYFQALYDTGTKKETGKKVMNFLKERSQKVIVTNLFQSKALLVLFIKYNTPNLSIVTAERLFSMEKNVLKPKRAGLSDSHRDDGILEGK